MANIGLADEEPPFEYDPRFQHFSYLRSPVWPLTMHQQSPSQGVDLNHGIERIQSTQSNGYHQPSLHEQQQQQQHLMTEWGYSQAPPQYSYAAQSHHNLPFYTLPLQSSTLDMLPVSQPPIDTGLALDTSYMPTSQSLDTMSFQLHDVQSGWSTFAAADGNLSLSCPPPYSSSPTETHLEVRSLTSPSDSEGWITVENRCSFEGNRCVDPSETLHNRTSSESSWSSEGEQQSQPSMSGSFEPVPRVVQSPSLDSSSDIDHRRPQAPQPVIETPAQSSTQVSPGALVRPIPVPLRKATSNPTSPVRSPASQSSTSPVSRRLPRKSPIAKVTEKIIKRPPPVARADTEKRVGKRKGPLRPEQRKQASEIRKLRACLRCKFLKKTCDKGEPCAGCQPSHARLWQVPCTRIDIKEIGFFTKDYRADFARHLTFELSAGNIKGFSETHRTLFISHGYGQMLPLTVREVFVRDEKMFDLDWSETNNYYLDTKSYAIRTAPLYADLDCLSSAMMSDYLDRHLDVPGSFYNFVDSYCGETPFVTSMLKTAFNYYSSTKAPVIRKALKLLLAYSLTLHITFVEGIPEEEHFPGIVDDETSQYHGKLVAPNAVNFQVKTSMGNLWRDLQKEVLEELSLLYSSVYSGDKLKQWPTIFILATLLLAVWEFMQFDAHRVLSDVVVDKFVNDMETVPVGVVVGLFQAISQKLPSFTEWDTSRHQHVLQSNSAACKTMTEVRENVTQYEEYLRSRAVSAKYELGDFDCLSNKLISRLVIRAN